MEIGGVPPNASSPDGSVFHIMIKDSAHHQDLRFQDDVYDSKELLAARRMEQDCIGNGCSSNAVEIGKINCMHIECSIFMTVDVNIFLYYIKYFRQRVILHE